MKKIIRNKKISFYDDENQEIMYIDFSTDECIWYFFANGIIEITSEMELYDLLNNLMNNSYEFSNKGLPNYVSNYKDNDKLIWYSDCYYNPDDDLSVASISCLNIERKEKVFKIYCLKKIDEIIDRKNKTYAICFSPLGNGQYSKNLKTGLTFQDDFIISIYEPLLQKNKQLKKYKRIEYDNKGNKQL